MAQLLTPTLPAYRAQGQVAVRQNAAGLLKKLERAKGIEPSTYSLGSCRSTTELRPQNRGFLNFLSGTCRKTQLALYVASFRTNTPESTLTSHERLANISRKAIGLSQGYFLVSTLAMRHDPASLNAKCTHAGTSA
jgi:hypothetical protein